MNSEKRSRKYCTVCGAQLLDKNNRPAIELYDEELHRKSNILKLMLCSSCGQVADKYIECDGPLLLIDLALQSKEAYRNYWLKACFVQWWLHTSNRSHGFANPHLRRIH